MTDAQKEPQDGKRQPPTEELYLDPGATTEVQKSAIRAGLVYSTLGLIVGSLFAGIGLVLFILGVAGKSTLIVKWLDLGIELTDAAPGLILAALGVVIVIVTRLVIEHHKK